MSLLFWKRTTESKTHEVNEEHPLPVQDLSPPTPDGFFDDTGATSTTAQPLTAILSVPEMRVRQVLVQNDPDSTVDVLVGNAISQSVQIRPGEGETIPIDYLGKVFVKSVSGTPSVNVHASTYSRDS